LAESILPASSIQEIQQCDQTGVFENFGPVIGSDSQYSVLPQCSGSQVNGNSSSNGGHQSLINSVTSQSKGSVASQ